MRKFIFVSAIALLSTTTPVQAQILGGLGGGIGGAAGGMIPHIPTIPTIPALPQTGASTLANGAGTLDANVTKSVDPKSGKASANGSANGSASGVLDQTVATPARTINASGSGAAQGGGNGGADAQLVGTDAVQGALSAAKDRGSQLASNTRDHAANGLAATRDRTGRATGSAKDKVAGLTQRGAATTGQASGNASGEGQGGLSGSLKSLTASGNGAANGSASGSASGSNGSASNAANEGGLVPATGLSQAKGALGKTAGVARNANALDGLSGSGSGSANGSGSARGDAADGSYDLSGDAVATATAATQFVVTPGMKVVNASGDKVGKVRKVFTDSRGRITGLLVKSGNATALLPADNFSASGSTLVSAMGSAEISSEAKRQDAEPATAPKAKS
ncbi:MAG: PRC-barrel domain-containing protein [Sphingomonadales bacterium]|nr:PRC-barrel domain-containing protein [Sphingomonadales bacterium]